MRPTTSMKASLKRTSQILGNRAGAGFRLVVIASCFLAAGLPVAAAEGAGAFGPGWMLAGKIFNFVVVFGGLGWLLRKPLVNFFRSRTSDIRKKLEDAEKAKADALAKLAETEQRLQRLDDETAAIRRQFRLDAEAEQRRILAQAEAESEKMKQRARTEIGNMKKQALDELKRFAAEQALEKAAEILRAEIRPEDEDRLFHDFIGSMGDKH